VLIALAVPSAILLAVVLRPFLEFAFGFDNQSTTILMAVTRAFLAGLLSHCLLELGSRIYFARQNALIPFAGSAVNLVVYILCGPGYPRRWAQPASPWRTQPASRPDTLPIHHLSILNRKEKQSEVRPQSSR
jgi:hypothetical protein